MAEQHRDVTGRPGAKPAPLTMARAEPEPNATDKTIRNGMKPRVNTAANSIELLMNPSSPSCFHTRPGSVGSRRSRPALNTS
jgi:hypothetical protein